MSDTFEIGELVKLVGIPADLPDDELQTPKIFALCLGRVFPVASLADHLIELEVGEVVGASAVAHSIWIEPQYLERAK